MDCAANRSPRRPSLELADIVRAAGEACRRSHALSPDQTAVLRDVERCRTAALGGHLDVCDRCTVASPSYNSCRNRHCPKCQGLAQAKWIAEREKRILPVRHFHVVFTLPSELHALTIYRREELFRMLFSCASQTLLELGRGERHLGAELGLTAVLHTWTRELLFHRHVHCIVTGGGLSPDGDRWIDSRKKFLFPIHVIGALFRGKFLAALRKGIVALNDEAVTFRTKNGKTLAITPTEFLRRFLLHVLPPGFVKMRHFGLLAAGNVNTKLPLASQLLHARTTRPTSTQPSAKDILDALIAAKEDRRCPACRVGTLLRRPLPPDWIPTPRIFDSS